MLSMNLLRRTSRHRDEHPKASSLGRVVPHRIPGWAQSVNLCRFHIMGILDAAPPNVTRTGGLLPRRDL